MAHDYQIPVPRQWSSCIKSAFLHTISLASAAFTSTCAFASKRRATGTGDPGPKNRVSFCVSLDGGLIERN
jgi:hypothetical protein